MILCCVHRGNPTTTRVGQVSALKTVPLPAVEIWGIWVGGEHGVALTCVPRTKGNPWTGHITSVPDEHTEVGMHSLQAGDTGAKWRTYFFKDIGKATLKQLYFEHSSKDTSWVVIKSLAPVSNKHMFSGSLNSFFNSWMLIKWTASLYSNHQEIRATMLIIL